MVVCCPRCKRPIPRERIQDHECWCSCGECNILFPFPVYQPSKREQPEHSKIQLIRNKDKLIFIEPAIGSCANWSRPKLWLLRFLLVLGVIALVLLVLGILSLLKPGFLGGVVFCVGLFLGMFYIGFMLGLWGQNRFIISSTGIVTKCSTLFLPNVAMIARRDLITMQNLACEPNESYRPEWLYSLNIHCFPKNSFVGEKSIPYGHIKTQAEIDWIAYEIVEFFRSIPPVSSRKPTDALFDRVLRGETPFFTVYCPSCRMRHQIEVGDFRQHYQTKQFWCRFCTITMPIENALYTGTDVPVKQKPISGKLRNKIHKSDEQLEVRTRSHLQMLGIKAIPYLMFMVPCYCILTFGLLGVFWGISIASGDFRPGFASLPCGVIGAIFGSYQFLHFVQSEICRWTCVFTRNQVVYKFGFFREVKRSVRLIPQFRVQRRNEMTQSSNDPDNPVTNVEHALTLYFGYYILGEIPCRDALEVDSLYTTISDFYPDQKNEGEEEDKLWLETLTTEEQQILLRKTYGGGFT